MAQFSKREPWNPTEPVKLSPLDYEREVVAWLRRAGARLGGFEVKHLPKISGAGGEYTLDGWAEFEIFDGAAIKVLIECKHHSRPVEREIILSAYAKLQDIGGHKAIIFSVSGFQKGAIEYATPRGIALVGFVDGQATYFTKSADPSHTRTWRPTLPKYAGQFLVAIENGVSVTTVSGDDVGHLAAWLCARDTTQ